MRNILFVCLDSVRYDTFEAAEAKNMKAMGEAKKVHSFACWTIPSMMGYLLGFPPIGSGISDLFNREKRSWYTWAPRYFLERGWATAWLSSNASILQLDMDMKGGFSRDFKHFKAIKYPSQRSSSLQIVAELGRILEKEEVPIFATILVMDTHRPYNFPGGYQDIDPEDPEGNFENQVKAIEYFDKFFALIIDDFKKTGRNVDVIITSDHGELFGPVYWSHDPSTSHLRFDEKLFEIPLIMASLRRR